MKIDKTFARFLKKNKAFFEFVKLKKCLKNTQPLTYYNLYQKLEMMPCINASLNDYFKYHMAERKRLNMFLKEVKKQHRKLHTENVCEIIDMSINWEKTSQGHFFWSGEHYAWRNHAVKLFFDF